MKAPGSPAWRRNGRKAEGQIFKPRPIPSAEKQAALAQDPATITDEQLAREALAVLREQMLNPQRHATAVTGAARALLEFTKSKPKQDIGVSGPDGGAMKTEHTIRFVDPPAKS